MNLYSATIKYNNAKSWSRVAYNQPFVPETVSLTLSTSNCRVWHDTAIPFKQVVEEFEGWLAEHGLWGKETDGALNDAAFVTW